MTAIVWLLFLGDVCGEEIAFWLGVCAAEDDGFVDGEPFGYSVMVPFEDHAGVFDEVGDDIFGKPAAVGVLEVQREIPVVESYYWLDSVLEASVDDIVVVVESLLVDRAPSEGEDPRPGKRERVRRYANGGDAGDI